MKVVSIVGRSNSGKTTVIVKLISELKQRGYRVGVIKHTHHDFDIDHEGKDTWYHQQAGADTVMIASPNKVATIRTVASEPPLDELLLQAGDLDLVITEGYKKESQPKIEVYRDDLGEPPLFSGSPDLLAMISADHVDSGAPHFKPEDINGITDLIETTLLS